MYTKEPPVMKNSNQLQMCGADGADPDVCLDGCSGYEALIDEDEYAYRYYTVRETETESRCELSTPVRFHVTLGVPPGM